jgi:hypothetical protein
MAKNATTINENPLGVCWIVRAMCKVMPIDKTFHRTHYAAVNWDSEVLNDGFALEEQ